MYGAIKLVLLVLFVFSSTVTFLFRVYARCRGKQSDKGDPEGRDSQANMKGTVQEPDNHFEIQLEEQESPSGKYNEVPDGGNGTNKSVDTETSQPQDV
jgi:hypothetical protein